MLKMSTRAVLVCVLTASRAFAQDPTGTIEGVVTDRTAAAVAAAKVTVRNTATGFAREALSGPDGFYRVTAVPVGTYSLAVEAPQFAAFSQNQIQVSVNQAVRVDVQLSVGNVAETVTVRGGSVVDTSSNVLGRVVTGASSWTCRSTAATSRSWVFCRPVWRRSRAVWPPRAAPCGRGRRTRSTACAPSRTSIWSDGAQNMNRVDGGYALKVPVDAIAEFRILTQSAPAEYGGTGGATTSVVTKSGEPVSRQRVRVRAQR